MARSHDLELCGGGIAQCDAATVHASVLMCDAANCACVSVDVWYSGADILTQARRPSQRVLSIHRFIFICTLECRSFCVRRYGEYACSC